MDQNGMLKPVIVEKTTLYISQVLAHRCTSWESQDQSWEMSALASQVAMVLTNHLARAIDCAGVQDTSGNDILHNVLSLLLDLSK